ncbi:MAG: flavin reductase [Deltaproteobacteria bacterium]|nr:flavin reductase [Deltaproteobacteria bacterium]NND30111.1 flavin reductase [Myxococcales bacterium]MBT8465051.1 flavin reductase [Deltaproteobacteria bacterium]MBT8483041.1 flavin reductase [Deltaproteobacteria bacterium]NNK08542.1 flavin reductase [Myxococcales bacterium]
MIPLELEHAVWEQVYMVAPLTIVGTREPDGTYDLAPKHLAIPMSWQDHYGFVCTPSHATYANAMRERCFTVSFPRPEQILLTSLAAAPRCDDDQKYALQAIPTVAATKIDGVLLDNAYLHFECELDRVVDDLGENSLIIGRIVAAAVAEDALRDSDRDAQEMIAHSPMLAYLHPGRFAEIVQTNAFPYHVGFKR